MQGFKPYAFRALVFALAASVVCVLFNDLLAFLLAQDAVGFVPKLLALSLGGVHSPSYFGLFAGFFLEWAVLALLVASLFWILSRSRGRSAT